jgi:hypothetical protein
MKHLSFLLIISYTIAVGQTEKSTHCAKLDSFGNHELKSNSLSVSQISKSEGYDVTYYKLDLNMTNTSTTLSAYAQINDSIPNINLIKIDSVVSMRVAPDQESVANLMDGSVYSTLVSSKTILSKGKSKKLIKYISKPKSFVMNEVANASNTHAICFYAQGRTAVLLLFNVSTGFSRFGCYTPIEGFPREISASSPFFYEYKLTPRAQKKLKSLF